ncbi:hypothetical protein HK096_010569 [Nowakowskiella sp. JEL0078]|nr:hypothetical protein HK096_010569 [Nowakowskiella sp. JEL0078]
MPKSFLNLLSSKIVTVPLRELPRFRVSKDSASVSKVGNGICLRARKQSTAKGHPGETAALLPENIAWRRPVNVAWSPSKLVVKIFSSMKRQIAIPAANLNIFPFKRTRLSSNNPIESENSPEDPPANVKPATLSLVRYQSDSDEDDDSLSPHLKNHPTESDNLDSEYKRFMLEINAIEDESTNIAVTEFYEDVAKETLDNPNEIVSSVEAVEADKIESESQLDAELIESWRNWYSQWNQSPFSPWGQPFENSKIETTSDLSLTSIPNIPTKSKTLQLFAATNLLPDKSSSLHQRFNNVATCIWLLLSIPRFPIEIPDFTGNLSIEEKTHLSEFQSSLSTRYHDWSVGALDSKYFEEIIIHWESSLAKFKQRFVVWNEYFVQLHESGVFNIVTSKPEKYTRPTTEYQNHATVGKATKKNIKKAVEDVTPPIHPSRLGLISTNGSRDPITNTNRDKDLDYVDVFHKRNPPPPPKKSRKLTQMLEKWKTAEDEITQQQEFDERKPAWMKKEMSNSNKNNPNLVPVRERS